MHAGGASPHTDSESVAACAVLSGRKAYRRRGCHVPVIFNPNSACNVSWHICPRFSFPSNLGGFHSERACDGSEIAQSV